MVRLGWEIVVAAAAEPHISELKLGSLSWPIMLNIIM